MLLKFRSVFSFFLFFFLGGGGGGGGGVVVEFFTFIYQGLRENIKYILYLQVLKFKT